MANGKNLTKVTTYITRGKSFVICIDDENQYWGIPSEDVVDGIIQKRYNGVSGHRCPTIPEVMQDIEMTLDMRELVDSGINSFVASIMVSTKKTYEQVVEWLKTTNTPKEFYI